MFDLTGRAALVTGGSRGIGAAIARALADAGAEVFVNGRDPETAGAVAEAIRVAGGRADIACFDLADPDAVAAGVATAAGRQGRLDILVNNAGMTIRRPLASFDLASWRRVLDVNLTGCFVAAQAAAPLMPNGTGRIINVASILSLLARPGVAAYVATKTGLAGLTRALAVELAPAGVTVNAIAPGYIRTEMTEGLQADTAFDAQVRRRVPMARWGEPADISGAAVFLASDAARYLTGQLIAIDGGLVTAL